MLERTLGAAFDQQVSAWASRERTVQLRSGRSVPVRALGDAQPGDTDGALVLHFAFLTRDRIADLGADAFTDANRAITRTVLDLFAAGAPRALVYASSGAAHAADEPYGIAKQHDEAAFREACDRVGASCVIPRIFSISGPYMTKPTLYALGDLILQAQRDDRLRIRAAHPVIRSYVAAADLLALCLAAAAEPTQDLVFDSGGEIVEVGDLADAVRRVAGRPDLPIERTWDPAAPADRYVGDARGDGSAGAPLRRRTATARGDRSRSTAADLLGVRSVR